MFTLDDIQKVQQRAAAEKWPYPYLFNSLKALGIERYEVTVATGETKFVGEGASIVTTPERAALPVAETFNRDAVKAALARTQAGETDYPTFLAEIAAAGVSFYRVDMRPRTVTYHGPKPYKLVEPVPDTRAPRA